LLFANSPSARAEAHIDELRNALNDLATVVRAGRGPEAIQQVLNTVTTQTQDAQASVAAVPPGSARDGVRQERASVLVAEDRTLRALLKKVNWSIRVALTQQLEAIGQSVPRIKQVSVSQQKDGTLVVTVTGMNFAPQAILILNGRPQGIFGQQTTGQMVGTMSQSNWGDDTQMIGVLNPDGTATQIQVVFHDTDDQQQQKGGDDHGGQNGLGSGRNSTPTSGDDHGGSGKGGFGGKGSDG
jgi:hypothetical protein